MDKRRINDSRTFGIGMLWVIAFLGLTVQGCGDNRHMVLAATGTNIGVEFSQNPATQSPQAKLGYQRTELAIVPSNRTTKENVTNETSMGQGARDVADVVMELRYGGIFDLGATSGIYQRLAVGSIAVTQPGASLMFAKDANGSLTKDGADAVKSLTTVPAIDPEARKKLSCLSRLRTSDGAAKETINAAVKKLWNMTWDPFVDSQPNDERMRQLMYELEGKVTQC